MRSHSTFMKQFCFSTIKCARLGEHIIETTSPKTNKNNLLWLHGVFDSSARFRPAASNDLLRQKVTSYLLDARNHGKSEHTRTMSFPEMAYDLVDYIANRDMKDIYLLGHSMGGRTVMSAMRDHKAFLQDRIKGIIIVDVLPNPYLQKNPSDHALAGNSDKTKSSPREDIFRFYNEMKSVTLVNKTFAEVEAQVRGKFTQESVINSILDNIKTRKDGSLTWAVNLEAFENSAEDILNYEIKNCLWEGPRRVFVGAHSKFVNVTRAQEQYPEIFVQFQSQKELILFQNSGHFPHLKEPEKFVNEIVQFITEVDSDGCQAAAKTKTKYFDEALTF